MGLVSHNYRFEIEEENKIYGYENEFSQVILNIVNNAKDALVENEIKDAKIIACCDKVEERASFASKQDQSNART